MLPAKGVATEKSMQHLANGAIGAQQRRLPGVGACQARMGWRPGGPGHSHKLWQGLLLGTHALEE